jgi:hypothetical protein
MQFAGFNAKPFALLCGCFAIFAVNRNGETAKIAKEPQSFARTNRSGDEFPVTQTLLHNDNLNLDRTPDALETLPMIKLKNLDEGTEFAVTIVVSAVVGLLAFLFVALIVNMLGL